MPEVTHLISDRWTKGPGAGLQSWGLGSGASGSRALAAESQSTRCACFRSGLCLATRAGTVVSAEPVLPVSGVSFSFFPLRQHLASQTFGGHSCRESCCETDNKGDPSIGRVRARRDVGGSASVDAHGRSAPGPQSAQSVPGKPCWRFLMVSF